MSFSTDIVLATLNARYHHTAFGLRYLLANLGELQSRAQILEFTTNQSPRDIVERILARKPRIVGLGVYIWNTTQTAEVVSILKKVSPETLIVLGGPEVSFETETQSICRTADFTLKGEADFLFREFCENYLALGKLPPSKWISGEIPDIKKIASPYSFYSDEDIRNRIIYVEASRGCPFKCEYCLSSLDKSVRSFDLDLFLADLERLIARGARQFKFIDRTFNLSPTTCTRILQFFLDRIQLGLFLHFEMVPDRLPLEVRDLIRQFPAGSLQFEVGIQTWNPDVAKLVSRRQDYAKIRDNFKFLSEETGVHTHADLIVGLPGETLESFGEGFDAVAALRPDEIQVGILKRLKGTPIIRHDAEWGMVYQEHSPFQVLQTKVLSFEKLQKLGRFSQFWDLVANSGNFKATVSFLRDLSDGREDRSLFRTFFEMSEYLALRHPQGHGVALLNLLESLWLYLTHELKIDEAQARKLLTQDYAGTTKRDLPHFLREGVRNPTEKGGDHLSPIPKRQRKHLAGEAQLVSQRS